MAIVLMSAIVVKACLVESKDFLPSLSYLTFSFTQPRYLFDHRNASLQDFLINTFILGPRYGMGTKVINGFFLDDGWSTKADPVPWWAPPDYKQCDMYETGGPTEEDYYCTVDMGLTHEEVVQIATNYSKTWEKAVNAIVDNGGFGWPLLQYSGNFGRNQSEDPPTRPDNCKSFLRRSCVNGSSIYTAPLLYTFTGTQAGKREGAASVEKHLR